MLVISRRIGESFVIGEDIEATIIDITGEKVVVGISAPKSMPIARTGTATGKEELAKKRLKRGYGSHYRSKPTEEAATSPDK